MRALRGGIPRAFRSHKTPEGAAYGRYLRAMVKRLGSLGPEARPTLKQAGVIVVELDRLQADLETALPKRRRSEIRRARREARALRVQLLFLERRLEELAGRNGHGGDVDLAVLMGRDGR